VAGSSVLSSDPAPPPMPTPSDAEASTSSSDAKGSLSGVATALRDRGAHLRLWSMVVLGLAIDLWSKDWAFHTLRQGGRRSLITNILEFQTTLNPGALFGIGAGHTEVFLIASVLALILVLWMFAQSSRRQWLLHIALGAILAGALGNMYDRVYVQLVPDHVQTAGGPAIRYYVRSTPGGEGTFVLREYPPTGETPTQSPSRLAMEFGPPRGYVRDFIKIPTRWFGGRDIWPWVFNVADMLLVGGVGILTVRLLRERRRHGDAQTVLDDAAEKT